MSKFPREELNEALSRLVDQTKDLGLQELSESAAKALDESKQASDKATQMFIEIVRAKRTS